MSLLRHSGFTGAVRSTGPSAVAFCVLEGGCICPGNFKLQVGRGGHGGCGSNNTIMKSQVVLISLVTRPHVVHEVVSRWPHRPCPQSQSRRKCEITLRLGNCGRCPVINLKLGKLNDLWMPQPGHFRESCYGRPRFT